MMIHNNFSLFVPLILFTIVQSRSHIHRTDAPLSASSVCALDRPGFGQFERVQLSARSIEIQFKNIFYNFKCSSIRIDASIINTQTNQLDRTIENIQSNVIFIDRLLSNQNYSITLKLSDSTSLRLLPTQVFQTLPSSDATTVTLSLNELLSIEQIESFLLPHTHVYIVSLPSHLHQSAILGRITVSYSINGERIDYQQILKPLDQNAISRLGRMTRKTVLFSVELPFGNGGSQDYSSSLQLFFPNDPRQSLLDHPVVAKSPPGIAVDFQPIHSKENSGRSTRVLIRHLCSSYIEVKAIVYKDLLSKKIVARQQCDINKNETSLFDITQGQCSMLFDKLQPEQNYTLSIRATCPIAISPTSSYVLYDRARLFSFQTSIGSLDYVPFNLFFDHQDNTLAWIVQNNSDSLVSTPYLGPGYYFELLSKSDGNWTLIYHGNRTEYQLPSTVFEKGNLTFQLFMGNRYGRQANASARLSLNLDAAHQPLKTNNQMVIFTVLMSFLLLLLLFGFLFIGCYVRNKKIYGKLKQKYYQNGQMSDKELEHLRSLTYSNTLKDNILYTWNHTPTNVDVEKLPRVERIMIKLDRLIGKGAFGEVYAGTMKNAQPVAIKTLLSSASELQRVDFLKEAIIMNQFHHDHIVQLLGVCFHQDHQPQFLLLEFMEQGDLQNYLRRSRPNKDHDQCRLSYEDCLDIARQIADGACYLEQHCYVHRDLAARNCLVSSSETSEGKIVVKIGDFGLARMLSQQDYYRKTGEALLPVRWMAPESLLDAVFTTHSDIWSFGIVLWEIITLGQVPYSPLNNQQVISLITTTRGTLEKPLQCTQTLYELMLVCWNYIPENRVNFQEIHSRLNEILSDQSKELPPTWFSYDASSSSAARTILDSVLSHIEPPTSMSCEGSESGECRSSTSGCFSSMTESTSPTDPHQRVPPYRLRLIDDTTSNDFAADDEDDHSDLNVRSLQ